MVSGSVAADWDIPLSVAGSLGYRLNRVITLGTELTWTSLEYSLDDERSPTIAYTNTSRDVLSFTTNFRLNVPPLSRRLGPYVVVGGGVASDTVRYTITSSRPIAGLTVTATSAEQTYTATYLALVLGGGLAVVVTDHVSIDVDARGLYLRGARFGIGRLGVGGSYRF